MAHYQEYITNDRTGETLLIKSNDYLTFQSRKLKRLEMWEKQNSKEQSKEEAERMTKEAQSEIKEYQNILKATIEVNDKIDWDSLKVTEPFHDYRASRKPQQKDFDDEMPKRSFLMELVPHFKKKNDEQEQAVKEKFKKELEKHTKDEETRKAEYEKEKAEFAKKQQDFNDSLAQKQKAYEDNSQEGVVQYISLVLERSEYPDSLSLNYELHYEPQSKLLLIDIELPKPESVPSAVEFKYVPSKDEITAKPMIKRDHELLYNGTLYQIMLRTIHEVVESDYNKAVELIVVNGWVEGVSKKTGTHSRNCVMSLQVSPEEFSKINLEHVSAQDCFRHLKGVTAGSLVQLSPVKPIMVLNKEDKRVIQATNVLEGMDEQTNLATMEWADFEVLVRDLIGKEFSHAGCKVEVTRASRDGGVDAIAFDEDPIRGGKYVIQAKRYNNIVPLTAVRDLFGTVHNEGAVKGILITTSYFGKDSLEFANGKPLKLINGEELLYMFNKHGYNFKIELKAKKAASSTAY